MRFWFDILTPKQVMFFKRAVDLLRESGHEVLCTSRKYREVVELAKIKRLDLAIIGSHGGAGRYEKLRESANRTFELAEAVKHFGAEAGVAFASPEGARVAFGLDIRHISFNDSPHAEAVARLTVPLTSRLLCPWVIPYSAWAGYGIARKNVSTYRALDPAAWLKHGEAADQASSSGRTILLRLEESKASYIADRKLASDSMVDSLVGELWQSSDITVLCRYQDQIAEVESRYGHKVRVLKDVVDGTALIRSSDVFVGAGGTMTAEAALSGKPAVSIAPHTFYVEKYLVRTGLVKKAADSRALVRLCRKMLSDKGYRKAHEKKAAGMLAGMEDPTDRMLAALRL